MNFNDVAPGGVWQPEPAARYNQLNALLREHKTGGGSDGELFRGTLAVDFINASSKMINAFSAVSVTGAAGNTDMQLGRYAGNCPLTGIPAADDVLPWGIALGDTAPGAYGRLIVSGAAPADFTGSGKFVTPGPAGLTAGDFGNALVLVQPDFPANLPGVVILGGGGGSTVSDEYHGFFKLQSIDAATVEVVNGKTPGCPDCGYTDIPHLESIKNAVLALDAEKFWYIYLLFFYDPESKRYSSRIAAEFAADAVFSELLGTFRCGTVQQVLKISDRLVYGNSWYLS